MNKRVVRRLLDTFFRRRWLYIVPLVLFTVAGIARGFSSGSGYESVGVIDVAKDTLLSDLTSIRGENFGFETPATATAKTINALMGTDNFITSIAKSAGVTGALSRGELTADGIRTSLAITPDGDNLVKVVASTNNPELSARLAQGTMDTFMQYIVSGDVAESRAAEQFFNDQLAAYQKQLEQAQSALREYAASHPGGPQDLRPLDEQVEIERLKSAVQQAQETYSTAQGKSDEARLATEQSVRDVSQQLRIIDTPEVPGGPQPRLKTVVLTTGLFMFVGMFISFGAVVLASVLDRSLRTPDDVEQLLGMSVLAVVPDVTPSKRERRASKKGKKDAADVAAPATRTPTKASTVKPAAERQGTTRTSRGFVPSGRVTSQRGSSAQSGDEGRDPLRGQREDPAP
jgi:uncharacterized protein involved in exopolysaccharide biosynthesis